MVAAEVKGIQKNNISGCVKHYVFNSQENDRSGMSSNVPVRAAKELYYKPFQAAVDAGVGSAMCSCECVFMCDGAVLPPLILFLLTPAPPPHTHTHTPTHRQPSQWDLGL
jgi:hypothetical protein